MTETSIIMDHDNLYIVFIFDTCSLSHFFAVCLTFMVSKSYAQYTFNPRLSLSLNSEGPTPITGQADYDFFTREQMAKHLVYVIT